MPLALALNKLLAAVRALFFTVCIQGQVNAGMTTSTATAITGKTIFANFLHIGGEGFRHRFRLRQRLNVLRRCLADVGNIANA